MRLRRIWPAALFLLVPVLTGCNDDGTSGSDDPTSESPSTPTSAPTSAATETTSAATETTSAAPAGLPAACDLVTSDDVAKALGVAFSPAEADTGDTTEGKNTWQSDECSFEARDLVDVTVKVTGPDDFTTGTFGCPQPSDATANVEPVDDIAGATGGWWSTSQAPPLEATLRACSAAALVEVELEYEDGVDYEGDPRNQSVALAELVLAALQG